MLLHTSWLGLMGMPRRYMDYPENFAGGHMWVSLAAIVFTILLTITLLRLWILSRQTAPPIEEAFT